MSYTEAFAGKDYPFPIRIDNHRFMRGGEFQPRPWTPLGTIVLDGISIVPKRQIAVRLNDTFTGMEVRVDEYDGWTEEDAVNQATEPLPRSLVIFGKRFTDPADIRHFWSMLADSDRAEQIKRDRREWINAKIHDVFKSAQEYRLERAQIQDPGVRDALSLT